MAVLSSGYHHSFPPNIQAYYDHTQFSLLYVTDLFIYLYIAYLKMLSVAQFL
jgi:hypothetical protein